MKLIVLAVFAILGYVGANCGCLKCSKHLHVIGEIPGAPGQVPIKVIYRCEHGYPNLCDTIVPVQPTIQAPVPKPEPITPCGGQKFSIQMKPFYKPFCHEGGYYGSGTIRGPHAAGNPCLAHDHVYDYSDYYGPIVPVKIEAPAPTPKENKQCYTLQGLRTAVDRIIIPAPAICQTGITPFDRYVCSEAHTGCGNHHHHHHHHNCYSGCNSCHNRYDSQNLNTKNLNNLHSANRKPLDNPHSANRKILSRSKRQLIQHGYKFIVNMLPPFIQEPIKDTVNKMAITHPDKKLRKIYNLPPPPLTLKEKIDLKHKENVAVIKNKLYGTPIKKTEAHPAKKTYQSSKQDLYKKAPIKKYHNEKQDQYKSMKKPQQYSTKYIADVDDSVIQEEAENFADNLLTPEQKKKKAFLRSRHKKIDDGFPWLKEMTSAEILGKHFLKKYRKGKMTDKEKSLFVQKLKKLNDHGTVSKSRTKRSIIIGSDELDLPLYQIKIRETEEENEIDQDYDDDYDYDYEDDNDDERVGISRSFDASQDEIIRKAIREELKKFRQVQSEEDLTEDPVALFQNDKYASKFPLLRILTFPMKIMKGIKNNEEMPIVGAVPKMIIGTKKYFMNFGKNLKKNFLHFTSDIIGDFDQNGATNDVLANIIATKRSKRSVDLKNSINDNQNFQNVSIVKVRKKRYILKMVDDDEIEELLRQKLGKMFDQPQRNQKPKRKYKIKPKMYQNSVEQKDHHNKKRPKKYYDDSVEVHRKKRRPDHRLMKKQKDDSMEDLKKKIIIEPIKPKVIIDNNGLPFMEVNGYKRPLFMKNLKTLKKEMSNRDGTSKENVSYDRYDSSEEDNLQTIHHVIDNAKNRKGIYSRNTELPLETLKDKLSQLLFDIDTLVHMDFEKYDDLYDDLIEIQSVKTSIVQSWKRLIMDKKINNYDAKIGLLEKFEDLQHLKTKTMQAMVYILRDDCENSFALSKVIEALMALHKIQCVIDQVVDCFQEKFKTGAKFELAKEIKFVDFLASLKFVHAKTRNDMVCLLKEERDKELQNSVVLLEKLQQLLVEGDETAIEDEANVLWEMKHVQQMQISTVEEMCDRLHEGFRIKKNMKILFDLAKRLKVLQERENTICSVESKETSCEDDCSKEKKKKEKKKFDIEEFKKKWQDKLEKQKELIEDKKEEFENSIKKKMAKLKELKEFKKKSKSVEECESESDEDENE